MTQRIEIIAPHLAAEARSRSRLALLDLTGLDAARLDLLARRIIALPLFQRVVLALGQNGITRVLVHYAPHQEALRRRFQHHPLTRDLVQWLPAGTTAPPPTDHRGLYLIHPGCLINGRVLAAFDRAVRAAGAADLYCTPADRPCLWWAGPDAVARAGQRDRARWPALLQELPARAVTLDDPLARLVRVDGDAALPAAEALLCEEVTRGKGGWLAKRLNEPVSLWLARRLAETPVTPNWVTLINGLLGLTSAALVAWGAAAGSGWLLAAGGLLFYAVDIFDGVDGELARLTFQSTPRGSFYDTLGDNLTVGAFLAACAYAGLLRAGHWGLYVAAGLAVAGFAGIVLYLARFTRRHYGRVHLRLYETRFMARLPRDRPLNRAILAARHLYTKDIYGALMAVLVILGRPDWVLYLGAGLALAAAWAYTYLGRRYAHLVSGS